jgi:predicted RecA/RadA family phage recombinase
MRNYKQPGDVLSFTAPLGGVVSGNLYLVGGLAVVAESTVAAGASFEGQAVGVFELPKTAGQLWTEGQKIYWDTMNFRADNSSMVGPLIGVATEATSIAASPLSPGKVRLNGNAPP